MTQRHCLPVHQTAGLALILAGAMLTSAGCGSSNSGPTTSTKAAVSGPSDMHCTMNGMAIKQAIGMCMTANGGALTAADAAESDATADASSGEDGAAEDAGGSGDDGAGGGGSDYGPTLYNAEGDDDDCKYHVTWTSTDVKENVGVTFDVNVIRRIDDQPATGADVAIEAFLTDIHPTPTNSIPSKESAGGNYRVGPLVFDAPGKWTVRFHFFEMCSDAEDSPHGHAAFFINVP